MEYKIINFHLFPCKIHRLRVFCHRKEKKWKYLQNWIFAASSNWQISLMIRKFSNLFLNEVPNFFENVVNWMILPPHQYSFIHINIHTTFEVFLLLNFYLKNSDLDFNVYWVKINEKTTIVVIRCWELWMNHRALMK